MACVNPDVTLSDSAKVILVNLKEPKTSEELAQITSIPLYKIRSAIRDLVSANLVSQIEDKYIISPEGLKKIS